MALQHVWNWPATGREACCAVCSLLPELLLLLLLLLFVEVVGCCDLKSCCRNQFDPSQHSPMCRERSERGYGSACEGVDRVCHGRTEDKKEDMQGRIFPPLACGRQHRIFNNFTQSNFLFQLRTFPRLLPAIGPAVNGRRKLFFLWYAAELRCSLNMHAAATKTCMVTIKRVPHDAATPPHHQHSARGRYCAIKRDRRMARTGGPTPRTRSPRLARRHFEIEIKNTSAFEK